MPPRWAQYRKPTTTQLLFWGGLATSVLVRGGVCIKSLLFSVGRSAESSGPLDCGIVGSVYLSLAEGPARGSLPSYQVAFAERRLGSFLREHWERFGACPNGSGAQTGG